MIRILRPTQRAELISARVFDEHFTRNLGPALQVETTALVPWLDAILGPCSAPYAERDAAEHFAYATRGLDFLCPDHHAIPLSPLFLSLRNRARAPVRLLLIAHAPGAYGLEWALMRPLLAPGDLIIAPSRSAREVIECLCPDLGRYINVIPHPIAPLPRVAAGGSPRIVSLGRLHRTKLVHRQIEAMGILKQRGGRVPLMQIAGPLHQPGSTAVSPYARSLAAKIERLVLADHVDLVSTIEGDADKAGFLAGALMLMNLSVSIEESFGKAGVEALGVGVPVIATRWDGLPEIVGDRGGACVDVIEQPFGMDVDAARLAEQMERLLEERPSADACREQAQRCHPGRVAQRYRTTLTDALDVTSHPCAIDDPAGDPTLPAAPSHGLLSRTAPLTEFSWPDLFTLHLEDATRVRRAFAGQAVAGVSDGEQLRSLLILGLRAPLERLLAGHDADRLVAPTGMGRTSGGSGNDFLSRVAAGAASGGIRSSRLACLDLLCAAGDVARARDGLVALHADGVQAPGVDYLDAEIALQSGQCARAFQLCVQPEDPELWGELAAPRLRQLARVCRSCGLPGFALPWLRDWLDAFPDGPDSGLVWLDRGLNAIRTSPALAGEARVALSAARRLLGALPELDELDAEIPVSTETVTEVAPLGDERRYAS